MPLRFYTNVLSQASRTAATGIMIVGLLLMGFGVIIIALPELFAMLAAMVFFVAGIGCAITAVKIFWAQRHLERLESDEELEVYRENVRIHREDHSDL